MAWPPNDRRRGWILRRPHPCCHTLILDLKILFQTPLLFSNAFKSTLFSTVLQLHTLLFQSFKFLHKIIQKGILVISYKGTHFSVPTICPWVFSICFHESLIKICTKSPQFCIWVSLSRFCPRGILVFSHQINFGQRGILKYLIFGSLFVLVHFVNFKCFAVRCFQITFSSQFY